MGKPWQEAKSLIAASATVVAASQSPGAGAIALVSTPVVLDTMRQVLITSGGNDSGITFTVFGTNASNAPISETITGGNVAAVATTRSFKTVTSITHTGSVAGTVSAGTNGIGSTEWWVPDVDQVPMNFGIGVTVSGTVNYTVEYTYDDPNAPFSGPLTGTAPDGSSQRQVTAWPLTALAAQSTNKDGSLLSPVKALRLTINSGTGEARVIAVNAGPSWGPR